ncbi:MAG: hypothetical protein H7124_09600 [Phycisphaerales bacterium]|nr:hypothetical protein [Hyphomonadaceae bacterium]
MQMKNAVLALAAVLAWPASDVWAQAGGAGVQALTAADVNGDGTVSRAEARALRGAVFGRWDADSDGAISTEERAAAPERQGRQLERADADSDGRISRAEFINQPMRMFDRFDANDNDALEASEIEAMGNAAQRFGG